MQLEHEADCPCVISFGFLLRKWQLLENWKHEVNLFQKIQLLVSHVELEWNLVGIILFKGFAMHLEE